MQFYGGNFLQVYYFFASALEKMKRLVYYRYDIFNRRKAEGEMI